jgi:glycosyltransferase involved in cell wall biosynthesis
VNDIALIMCTRNPRQEPSRRVLESLREQTLPKQEWELVIIDNGSDRALAEEWDLGWHPRSRHVRENVVGVLPARLRGIAETRADLLVFVDDDTVVEPDFLSRAKAIFAGRPDLGVFGAGVVEPWYERPPSRALLARTPLLGSRMVNQAISSSDPTDYSCHPYGAGLCLRREIAEVFTSLVDELHVAEVIGRRGDRLFSGEDDLFSWAAVSAGTRFGIFPELRLTHLIAAERSSSTYLLRLEYDHHFSQTVLHYLLTGDRPRVPSLSKYPRLLRHLLGRGVISTRCRLAQLRGIERGLRYIEERRLLPLRARVNASRFTFALGLAVSSGWTP